MKKKINLLIVLLSLFFTQTTPSPAVLALLSTNPITATIEAGVVLGIGLKILYKSFFKSQKNASHSVSTNTESKQNDSEGCQCGCGHLNKTLCNSNCGCKKQEDKSEKLDFFDKLKKVADKKLRHKRFGTFYRDPKSKLWWSRDLSRHGGSRFKVFRETARGLEWIYDADAIGNQILNKHKSFTGTFISYKEVMVYS